MEREQSVAIWAEAQRHLEDALPEVSALMEREFSSEGAPMPGSGLDQCGLRDGATIARDYMAHNEWGLALEHLCYMVEEASLPISAETYSSLQAAVQVMGLNTRVLPKPTGPRE